MTKANLQIRVSEDLVAQIHKVAGKAKSAFIREAIEEKIRAETDRRLEQEWIGSLNKHPEDAKEAEDWLKAESWGSK